MASVGQGNIAAMGGLSLAKNTRGLSKVLHQISTGKQVNNSKDDASGYSIANKIQSSVLGSEQASKNSQSALQMTRIADEALSNMVGSLQRIRVLAQNSVNGTNSSNTRRNLNEENQQLLESLKGVATGTKYGSLNLLDGSLGNVDFQIGSEVSDKASIQFLDANLDQMGTHTTSLKMGGVANGEITANQTIKVTDANGKERNVSIKSGDSAYEVAAAFNKAAGSDGVKAQASTNVALSIGTGTPAANEKLTINGTDIELAAGMDTNDLMNAINKNSALKSKGITAEIVNNKLILNQKDGKDLNISTTTASTIGMTSVTTDTINGTLNVSTGPSTATATTPIKVTGEVQLFGASGKFDLNVTTASITATNSLTGSATGTAVSSQDGLTLDKIDLSTVGGSKMAMHVIDAALEAISTMTSKMGALQARFENVIDLLDSSTVSMEAAMGSIVDANISSLSTRKANLDQQVFMSSMAISNANNVGMPIVQTLLR